MSTDNLLVELFVEELPPKALQKLGDAFAQELAAQLRAQGLATADSVVTPFASPRRLAAYVTAVASESPEQSTVVKLMPRKVGYSDAGTQTAALTKRLEKEGYLFDDPSMELLPHFEEKGVVYVALRKLDAPVPLKVGLDRALGIAIVKLPIPKMMSYQPETDCELSGWSSVHFVRPAHGLLALHGSTVVPVEVLGLSAGNQTQGHRFEARVSPVVIGHADAYAATLSQDGAVIASFAERRADIERQLQAAATQVGGGVRPIEDEALLDEVTGLVERPNVLVCEFEKQFLEVPQECLILTMKANQKYFPLLDAAGRLTHQFLVVSNITPDDASAVIQGNERVVRPRLADAQFFFNQDRKKTLESRVDGLNKVVYHNKLGSQGDRMTRVCAIAKAIGQQLGGAQLADKAVLAARLAKTDLLTDMVGEFPELQGTMGAYYARNDGLSEDIANAISDHYCPRFAGDHLPRNRVGLVLALADKLETLVGMFGIGNLPTGDKDPFALRRHALGVVRMLMDRSLQINVRQLIDFGHAPFMNGLIAQKDEVRPKLELFFQERIFALLESEGHPFANVSAVLAVPDIVSWGEIPHRLAAVSAFAALPESAALAAANKRIGNILKKAAQVDAHVSPVLLKEPAEMALYSAMQAVLPRAQALFEGGDYTGSLQALAALRAPVDAFFDGVMVNAEEMDLRLNRQGLLKSLFDAMNRVAVLSRLAT